MVAPLKSAAGRRITMRLWIAVVVGLVVAGAGAAGRRPPDNKAEIAALQATVANEKDSVAGLQETLQAAHKRTADAEKTATGVVEARNAQKVSELDKRSADIDAQAALKVAEADKRKAELDAKEADLVDRETAVGIRQEQIDATSFSAGVHRVGTDVQPGRYRTQHSGRCYWAKLREDEGIIDNFLAAESGVANVTIDRSVYKFETSGCGTWEKVG